ncbi:MAG TPA: 50S ribosomal protein L6 [Sedimentisphaerales bacterium]|nr:50S ribosomal protein L6 [Sedimentisphaerales bacterium]
MSRIGKKPVSIPETVKVEHKSGLIKVSGPLGNLEMNCHALIKVKVDESGRKIVVENEYPDDRRHKQLHGTMRALIANMVAGVSKGFAKNMEIYGTGYNVKEQGGKVVFQIGLCHPVELKIPEIVKVKIVAAATRGDDVPAKFTLSSVDKGALGQFAAEIRKIKPPEPYKGKGIRYADEHIRRKAGKAFTSGTA